MLHMMPPYIARFIRYSTVGVSTFALDLCLLYVLSDAFSMNYLAAAGLAFAISVSVNYFLSRKYVFKGTSRNLKAGFFNFISIALIGLLFVIGGMYALVSLLGLGYLVSRIIIAGVTGFWNYLLNLFVNFKVAGKH